MMAEFFRSETTFSRSEPLFPPPFPQAVWWLPKGPRRAPVLPLPGSGLCHNYWLTLLVSHLQHSMRTWCFIQRKISLIASSQEKSHSNQWDAASGRAHGMISRVLILLLLSVVFPSCLSQRSPSHSFSAHKEKKVSERKLGIASV